MEAAYATQLLSKQTDGEEGLLSNGWFDLHALLDRFVVQISAVARATGKFVDVNTLELKPRYFSGNHLRLTEVLNNVAAYALSHLIDGGILFSVHATSINLCKYRIDIVAVATGTGIPSDKFNTVFLPDYSTEKQNHNTLFAAKTICSLLGGDLTIENTFGWGTRYSIHMIMESELPGYLINNRAIKTTNSHKAT